MVCQRLLVLAEVHDELLLLVMGSLFAVLRGSRWMAGVFIGFRNMRNLRGVVGGETACLVHLWPGLLSLLLAVPVDNDGTLVFVNAVS